MWIPICLLSTISILIPSIHADHSDLVMKAIQQSRQRQSSRVSSANTKPSGPNSKKSIAQQRPLGQTKFIDIDGLNNLIKSFDKTWVMPKVGSKEPTGSNFQYKKTCASIYKARPGACSQLGFGSMCFNYCYEKGDKVQYQCVDASDAAYCKSSSNFSSMLSKFKKDAYKAKAYIHQMISRCFATSLCNGNGILEAQPIEASTPKTREMNHLKLTKSTSNGAVTKKGAKSTTTTSTTSTTTSTTSAPEVPNPIPKKKKVPEWQKLLNKSTTEKSVPKESEEEIKFEEIEVTTEGEEEVEEVEIEEEIEEEEEEETTISSTTTTVSPIRGNPKKITPKSIATTTTPSKATWRPLRATTPSPPSELVSHTSEKTPKEDTFWNRFQPNTWYQSIHYMTNTGR